jgi:valyl-tRNA synthetase
LIRVLEATLRLAHPVIPFITEELWQTVAPLAGKTGESIMVAPFPQPDEKRIDAKVEAEVAAVKELVNGARNLRSTMGISPAAKVAALATDYPASLPAHKGAITALARLSELSFVPALPKKDAPVAITPAGKLMLEVEIDREAERSRIAKEIERNEKDLATTRAQLSKSSFVERAPATVVAEARKRLADLEARHADLRTQLGKLS